MTEGLERRAQAVDNLRGQEAVNPVTRSVPGVSTPPAPSVPVNTYGAQIAQQVNQFASGRLAEIQQRRQELSMMDGQIAGLQGASFESVEMEGDKWALEGWRVVTAQTMSSGLLRAQENEIAQGGYEQSPDQYRETLVNRIDGMTSSIPDERTRELAREQLMQQMPTLVDAHMRQNISFREQQNFDALSGSIDTLSRDNSATGMLVAFATGESEATSGLSVERRRAAVVQGVVNAFTNNNPAAFAHLEAAGFLTTENLTASQIQTIRSAQRQYEARFREVINTDHIEAISELEDRVTAGGVDPLVAVEELAAINARYGLQTGAAEGGQIYDRARAGVEFAEGTRGLNIQAAGTQGDYELQARLIRDTILSQDELTGGALALSNMSEGMLASRLESHRGNLDGLLNEIWEEQNPGASEGIQPVAGAQAIDPRDRSAWLVENTANSVRNDPLHNRLVTALGNVLPAMGLRFEVNSGGQGPEGSGDARTGATRHDHGLAADGVLYLGDTLLDHSNPEHIPIFQEVVQRLRAQGLTGFGAGMGDGGYMGNNHVHFGYGAEAAWSSTESGAPVVGWLREAFAAGPLGNTERNEFISQGTQHFSDNRPDPQGERLAAERNLEQLRQRARIDTLEAMGPTMAENDELFMRGGRSLSDWRDQRQVIYDVYGRELDAERINQEQQMMRSVIGSRIQELQQAEVQTSDLTQETQTAVQLETSLAAAEVQLQERRSAFEAGTGTLTLDEINGEYMAALLGAYQDSGAELDPSRISREAANIVRDSSALVVRALQGQEEAALIGNAETAGTVGTLPQRLQDRALAALDRQIQTQTQNFRAEHPDAPEAIVGAVERQARIEYIARNGIVDQEVQQFVNLAASGQAWIGSDGEPNPTTVAGLHAFVSILSENEELAYQYVPDPVSRGRMLAAAAMIQTRFPDRDVFIDVDLLDEDDPVADAFHTTVQQVGLSLANPTSPEETETRVAHAIDAVSSGNITNTFMGGFWNDDVTDTILPRGNIATINRIIGRGTSDFDDVNASGRVDREAINDQIQGQVEQFLTDVVPHMPGMSTDGAVRTGLNYVLSRGAMMGNTHVLPPPSEPSIRSQMFPGQQVENPAAVNTAIGQWMTSPEVQERHPTLANIPNSIFWRGVPEYTVARINGQYVATILGHGNVILPLREIGDLYNSNR